MLLQQSAFFKLRTDARHDRRQPLRRCRASPGVARASRPWTIMLLQQSAFFKLRTDARHDRRQPLRRCRATSPCRGGLEFGEFQLFGNRIPSSFFAVFSKKWLSVPMAEKARRAPSQAQSLPSATASPDPVSKDAVAQRSAILAADRIPRSSCRRMPSWRPSVAWRSMPT